MNTRSKIGRFKTGRCKVGGLIAVIACLLLLPCAHARDRGNGSAAGGTSRNAAPTLEHCDRTLGTLTVVEDQEGDWYHYLTGDLRLGSTIPVIRLLVQQSNCFVLVERGRAMGNLLQERALMQAGELRKTNNLGKGQMVAADYTLNPSINFAESNAGGIGALLGAFGGKAAIAGALVSGLRFKKAATILTLIDNRSGVQLAASEGQGRKTDFGLGLLGGSGGVGGLGGYSNTPEGRIIAMAFADAYNHMVQSLRDYRAQEVDGGLGNGGALKAGK